MSIAPAAPPAFNPLDPAFIANPYPAYKHLRETQPVWKSPLGIWVLTRYDDIQRVLKDLNFVHDFDGEISDPSNRRAMRDQPVIAMLRQSMLVRDPPDHTRLRGLVAKAFTARRVDDMRGAIEATVARLLDAIVPRGKMDVIEDFAHKLPVIVICDMLGIPQEDRAQFLEGYRVSGRALEPVPMKAEDLKSANAGVEQGLVYFATLFDKRRKAPGDDLVTALLQVRDEQGGRLSDAELFANIQLLFAAGHETTSNLIGNGLLALHRQPDQWARLVAAPDLATGAVEELLRYDSSVQLTTRKAARDTNIAGHEIKRGEMVLCSLGAANHDPAIYEAPEKLDITRTHVKPLSFGGGIHHCLGAQLARLEAQIAFRALAERLPGLRLDNIDNPEWRPTLTLRRLSHLPAHWGM